MRLHHCKYHCKYRLISFNHFLFFCSFLNFWSVSKAQPVKLIYAYGKTDEIGYHQTRRGTKEVNLLNFRPRTASNSPDYFSITVENV